MANTTEALVKAFAPELASIDSAVYTAFIADAVLLISEDNITDTDYQELCQRYKVAHDLTLFNDADKMGNSITTQKVGEVTRQYSDPSSDKNVDYDRTVYGVLFKRLWYRIRRMQIV